LSNPLSRKPKQDISVVYSILVLLHQTVYALIHISIGRAAAATEAAAAVVLIFEPGWQWRRDSQCQ
jgi:hypothetical protein